MNKRLAAGALKEALSAHAAFTRWFTWCEGLHAAKIAAGVYDTEPYNIDLSIAIEETYAATHRRPPMPSKVRKQRMYEDIYRAARLVDLDFAPGSISTMEDIAAVADRVIDVLAV